MSLKDSMIEWGKTVNLGAEEVQPLIDIVESAMEDVKAKTEADATAAATEAFAKREEELKESQRVAYEQLQESVEQQKQALFEEVAEFADATAARFLTENQERLVQTDEYERMLALTEQVKKAFASTDLLGESDERVKEQEETNKALVEENQLLAKQLRDMQHAQVLAECTNGLTDIQKERVATLMQPHDAYQGDYKALVESVIGIVVAKPVEPQQAAPQQLNEDVKPESQQSNMGKYLQYMRGA